eukprot:355096-Chlamydomonas_euryale.AAC.2
MRHLGQAWTDGFAMGRHLGAPFCAPPVGGGLLRGCRDATDSLCDDLNRKGDAPGQRGLEERACFAAWMPCTR